MVDGLSWSSGKGVRIYGKFWSVVRIRLVSDTYPNSELCMVRLIAIGSVTTAYPHRLAPIQVSEVREDFPVHEWKIVCRLLLLITNNLLCCFPTSTNSIIRLFRDDWIGRADETRQ